ncbi:MAG TPA: DUF1499 domain-containing protein, partial [Woeseiaceae bacterium]|nr:DUF1499 domain-containing protein [Woeseiaceae bacterium]
MNNSLVTERRAASPAAVALTWVGFGLAVIGALLVLTPGPGYRVHLWSLGAAFAMIRWGAYCGGAAAILSLLAAILLFAGRGTRACRSFAVIGIAVGALAIGVPWAWLQHARRVPPIHDISTDTDSPPAFQAVLAKRRDMPNSPEYGGSEVARQQHAAYPDIKPIALNLPTGRVFQAALAVAKDSGWKIQAQDRMAGRIEATDTTFWFGFKDDVVILIRPHDTGSIVDVRSQSRIGKSDLGKNADRVRSFARRLKARLTAPVTH